MSACPYVHAQERAHDHPSSSGAEEADRSVAVATDPGVVEEVHSQTVTQTAKPWNVLVHDDPITLMSYVTMVLQKVFGYSLEKAESMMMLVHRNGRALVWTGAREQAELYVFKLHSHQLLATLEPGEG